MIKGESRCQTEWEKRPSAVSSEFSVCLTAFCAPISWPEFPPENLKVPSHYRNLHDERRKPWLTFQVCCAADRRASSVWPVGRLLLRPAGEGSLREGASSTTQGLE